jgi:ABC-2 type transport system permease protein
VADRSAFRARDPLWRSFRTAAWLGWQIESNWADPYLFAVYSIVKPLALAGILVVMYGTITRGNFASPVFTYMYLGNAFYLYVGAVMSGMAWAVIDDRERYRMLKSMYVAPVDIRLYLIGRGVARFVTGSVSVLVTLVVGVLFLDVAIVPAQVNWPLFAVALVVGIAMLAMMGLLLASLVLLLGHLSWSLGDAVAGSLFLFSGAVFPLEVLPRLLRPIGYAMPVTYWLELLRRALVGHVAQAYPTLAGISDAQLLAVLTMLTLALAAAAFTTFHMCDVTARERGLIDRTSNY